LSGEHYSRTWRLKEVLHRGERHDRDKVRKKQTVGVGRGEWIKKRIDLRIFQWVSFYLDADTRGKCKAPTSEGGV